MNTKHSHLAALENPVNALTSIYSRLDVLGIALLGLAEDQGEIFTSAGAVACDSADELRKIQSQQIAETQSGTWVDVPDNSMAPRFMKGESVLFNPEVKPIDGEYAMVILSDSKRLIRKLHYHEGNIRLTDMKGRTMLCRQWRSLAKIILCRAR